MHPPFFANLLLLFTNLKFASRTTELNTGKICPYLFILASFHLLLMNMGNPLPHITLPELFATKVDKIRAQLAGKKIVVAFSGGIDSTLIAYLANQFGKKIIAVLINAPTTPSIERENARNFAKLLGFPYDEIEVDSLALPDISQNTCDRCYFCKGAILSRMEEYATENGFDLVVDGTNYSDLGQIRPGLRALKESNAQSPLAEAELTKPEIVQISKILDLPTQNVPPQACLASRVPFDIPLTPSLLEKIDRGERYLREQLNCFTAPLRVRVHQLSPTEKFIARIELEEEQMLKILEPEIRHQVLQEFSNLGFIYTTLDLQGFKSGSMHAMLDSKDNTKP